VSRAVPLAQPVINLDADDHPNPASAGLFFYAGNTPGVDIPAGADTMITPSLLPGADE
jgi:hypothetical protein